jgi:hypothetical protein
MDEATNGLLLDITIVVRNVNAQNVSEWYFSRYELNAVASPSAAPTTRFPPVSSELGENPPTSNSCGMASMLAAWVVSVGAFIILV